MRIPQINNTLSFTRRPTHQEEPDLKETINKAYDAIGAKERVVITHGSCFPAKNRDSFIGSPYSKAAKEYIKFLSLYGFNGNQLGPCGELEQTSISPYNSSAFAKNRLFIDLEELTTYKYGNILNRETFKKVTKPIKNDKNNYTLTDFSKAKQNYNIALEESYKTFIKKLNNKQPQAIMLNKEFENFLQKNDQRLTEEAIFTIFSKHYQTDNFDKWNKLDSNLLIECRNNNKKALKRYNAIKNKHNNEIEQYKFEQFIATKQIKENKAWRDKIGFKYINDLLVGCSKMDVWRYKDAFLQDWEMGARENNSQSQRWHIPVIDPKKIMRGDKLNIGGEFLKEKIDFALEFCENVRVDHVMGLIEPYLMAKNARDCEFSTNSNKNKKVEMYISELKDPKNPNLEYDFYWDYPHLLENIVLPSFKEHGIDKNDVMWEDICSYPDRFKQVYSKLDLPKITNLDWERAEEAIKYSPNNWFIVGNHDNMPAMNYLKRKDANGEEYTKKLANWTSLYLAGYLNQDSKRAKERDIFCKKIDNDNRELVFAKFSELMTTPKFQISFDDLLGITDITYNTPGTGNSDNWKARITPDYLDKYYENLSSDNPTALNIPELLKQSLQAKIDMKIAQSDNPDKTREMLYEKYQPLLDKLEHYTQVLKKKSE